MPLYNISFERADNGESWATQIDAENIDHAVPLARRKARCLDIPVKGGSIVQRAGHPASDAHFQQMFGDFQK